VKKNAFTLTQPRLKIYPEEPQVELHYKLLALPAKISTKSGVYLKPGLKYCVPFHTNSHQKVNLC
jgi:hypothetical protein